MAHETTRLAPESREHEAVANARQRLELQKSVIGERHPEYATGLNQLALLMIMHGDPASAEPLLRQALMIRKEVLGERHPDYATNLSSLAGLLWARGDLAAAEPLLRQAMEVRRDVLGPAHPKTVVSQNSLEMLIRARGPGDVAAVTPEPEPQAEPVAVAEPVSEPAAEPRVPEPVADLQGGSLDERFQALTDEFARLASRLTEAVQSGKERKVPLAEDLLAELAASRRSFEALRDEARSRGAALGLADDPGNDLSGLEAIGQRIQALNEAETHRSRFKEVRARALAVLDRVLSLTTSDRREFTPLAESLARAGALRQAIAEAPAREIPSDAGSLAEGDHPFTALLALVEGEDHLSDDVWTHSMDVVTREFGRPLAVAAARAKVVLPGTGDGGRG